jgi:hypothetical protein
LQTPRREPPPAPPPLRPRSKARPGTHPACVLPILRVCKRRSQQPGRSGYAHRGGPRAQSDRHRSWAAGASGSHGFRA